MPFRGCSDCFFSMLEKSIVLRPRFFLFDAGSTKPSLAPLVNSSFGLAVAFGLPGGVILPLDPLKVEIDNASELLP